MEIATPETDNEAILVDVDVIAAVKGPPSPQETLTNGHQDSAVHHDNGTSHDDSSSSIHAKEDGLEAGTRRRGRPATKSGPQPKHSKETKKKKKEINIPLDNLTWEDVKCPICMDLFIEPVTYPCGHSSCLACHKESIAKASMQCHSCRTRLSVWNRNASKDKTFINVPFWTKIQEVFPARVAARQNGEDTQLCVSPVKPVVLDGVLVRPGEILADLEREQQRLNAELERQRQIEERESMELIRKMEEQEGPLPSVQSASSLEEDEKLARRLQAEEDATPTYNRPRFSGSGVMKLSKPKPKQRKLSFPSATATSTSAQTIFLDDNQTGGSTDEDPPPLSTSTGSATGNATTGSNRNAAQPNGNAAKIVTKLPNATSTVTSSTEISQNAATSFGEPQGIEDEMEQGGAEADDTPPDPDFLYALKLQAEEEADYKRRRQLFKQELFKNCRVTTRSKAKAAQPNGTQTNNKRQRDDSPATSQNPKRSRSSTATLTQATLDNFVETLPVAPSSSSSTLALTLPAAASSSSSTLALPWPVAASSRSSTLALTRPVAASSSSSTLALPWPVAASSSSSTLALTLPVAASGSSTPDAISDSAAIVLPPGTSGSGNGQEPTD